MEKIVSGVFVDRFVTPEQYGGESVNPGIGKLLFVGAASGKYMAKQVYEEYVNMLKENGSEKFPQLLTDITRVNSDGELTPKSKLELHGKDVFVFQALYDPTHKISEDEISEIIESENSPEEKVKLLNKLANRRQPSVNDNYAELCLTIRCLKESEAKIVTAVIPYMAYSRQDKPTLYSREPVSARYWADAVREAGADRVITWDIHAEQIRGFYYPSTLVCLDSLAFFVDRFKEFEGKDNVMVVSPDAGRYKFVQECSKNLDLKNGCGNKARPKPGESEILNIVGDFRGIDTVILLDDLIASGGSLCNMIKFIKKKYGVEKFFVGVSHALLVKDAVDNFQECYDDYGLEKLVVVNTVPQKKEIRELPFFEEHSVAKTLAIVTNQLHYGRSVSQIFKKK